MDFGGSKCTWKLGTTEKDPHRHYSRTDPDGLHPNLATRAKILPNALSFIGNTPLIRINRIATSAGVKCEMLAKCEFYNAGGSVKDRIGRRMVEDAEKSGRLKKGDVLIEPTSGNTGIGLALAAAIKGYRCIIVMPEKMSQEKSDVLRALGAEIVRTPTEAASESPESHISVALRLNREIPNSHILDQYSNPSNPLAHYDGTAEELLEQCDGKIDMIVIAAGTGGTIGGIGRKLKEKLPNIQIVGVDPFGSILAQPDTLNETDVTTYAVEGIGYDFIPKVLDRDIVTSWVKTNDRDSLLMARRLIKEEGLLVGGSSGGAMWAACQAAKSLEAGQRCVVLLADSVRNYMSKFLNDGWMEEMGFVAAPMEQAPHLAQEDWAKKHVSVLPQKLPMTVMPSVTCGDCVDILHKEGFDQMPVVGLNGEIVGVVTEGNLMSMLVRKKVSKLDPVQRALFKRFRTVNVDTPLGEVSRLLDRDSFVLVLSTQRCYTGKDQLTSRSTIFSIVTRLDLLSYILTLESVAPSPVVASPT